MQGSELGLLPTTPVSSLLPNEPHTPLTPLSVGKGLWMRQALCLSVMMDSYTCRGAACGITDTCFRIDNLIPWIICGKLPVAYWVSC